MELLRQSTKSKNTKQGIFSLEAILCLLMLTLALSWVITAIMQANVVHDEQLHADVATAHAEFIISGLQKAAPETLVENIRSGLWNYPNPPSITAAGMIPLPGESIMTHITEEGIPVVTVRWVDQFGQTKVVTKVLGGQ